MLALKDYIYGMKSHMCLFLAVCYLDFLPHFHFVIGSFNDCFSFIRVKKLFIECLLVTILDARDTAGNIINKLVALRELSLQ